ncbi:MAG: hypothetical protein ACK55I_12630, partial [bacterium]
PCCGDPRVGSSSSFDRSRACRHLRHFGRRLRHRQRGLATVREGTSERGCLGSACPREQPAHRAPAALADEQPADVLRYMTQQAVQVRISAGLPHDLDPVGGRQPRTQQVLDRGVVLEIVQLDQDVRPVKLCAKLLREELALRPLDVAFEQQPRIARQAEFALQHRNRGRVEHSAALAVPEGIASDLCPGGSLRAFVPVEAHATRAGT